MTKFEIHKKGGFSERKGIKNFSDIVQINSLNERTRNRLFSVIQKAHDKMEFGDNKRSIPFSKKIIEYIYEDIFSLVMDDIPTIKSSYGIYYDKKTIFKNIKDIFDEYEYNEIFDFIESFMYGIKSLEESVPYLQEHYYNELTSNINNVFIEENVNYKIIDGFITDIVDKNEIDSINEVLTLEEDVTKVHLEKAMELLYKNNDYDNSIKESISAVESKCQILTNSDKATLGKSLKSLATNIHPALKDAFEKLYGYTSDANGIRHANGLGEGNSTFAEAKYMLVSCTAFINYLRDESKEKNTNN